MRPRSAATFRQLTVFRNETTSSTGQSTTALIWLCLLLPPLASAQPSLRPPVSRFYVGTDAIIRREAIQLTDPGGLIAPSDWMWNFSYGLNVGYRLSKWATVETGLSRFTLADRLNFDFGPLRRSFSNPRTLLTVPFRVYVDPFAFSQARPGRLRLQLMGGVSAGAITALHRSQLRWSGGQRTYLINNVQTDQLTYNSQSQLSGNAVVLPEVGVNLQYALGQRLIASGTYGYAWGLHTVHQHTIRYSVQQIGVPIDATQSSAGDGTTVLVGLKYQFGPTVWGAAAQPMWP